MVVIRIAVLITLSVSLLGCDSVTKYAAEGKHQMESLITEQPQLRLESNKPGTAFCLGGKPVVAGDPGVTVQAGDRVYLIDPAPQRSTTVVAAQPGYFAVVDDASSIKHRLLFTIIERNRCTGSSAGRTCVTSQLTSDLKAFETFCANFP
jgi:hypothetical protein